MLPLRLWDRPCPISFRKLRFPVHLNALHKLAQLLIRHLMEDMLRSIVGMTAKSSISIPFNVCLTEWEMMGWGDTSRKNRYLSSAAASIALARYTGVFISSEIYVASRGACSRGNLPKETEVVYRRTVGSFGSSPARASRSFSRFARGLKIGLWKATLEFTDAIWRQRSLESLRNTSMASMEPDTTQELEDA